MPLSHAMLTRRCLYLLLFGTAACAPEGTDMTAGDTEAPPSRCGPASAVVVEVIDGDTVVLDTGEKIRYLMVDTPEITNGKSECFGPEARTFNQEYVLGQDVELTARLRRGPRRRDQRAPGRPRLRLRAEHPAQRGGPRGRIQRAAAVGQGSAGRPVGHVRRRLRAVKRTCP